MKKKQLKEMAQKTAEELEKEVGKVKIELNKLRLEVLSGKNKNKRLGKNLRKDLAQIKTIINEKGK